MTMGDGSGWLRSSQRKVLLTGAAEWIGTKLIHVYSLSERFTRSSGLLNRVRISTRNRPMRMGIWTINGPRQPMGLTPLSRYSRMVSWEIRWRSPS